MRRFPEGQEFLSLKRLNEVLNRIRSMKGVDDIFVIPILETFKDEHTVPLELREDSPKE